MLSDVRDQAAFPKDKKRCDMFNRNICYNITETIRFGGELCGHNMIKVRILVNKDQKAE